MEFRSSKLKLKDQPVVRRRPTRPNLSMCKKHPKHQQSPGVCSICLNEKLTQLSSRSTTAAAGDSSCSSSSLSSLSSSHYSASGSSATSPVRGRHRLHYRMASEGRGFSSMTFFKSGKNVLTKSRSLIFVTKNKEATGSQAVIVDDIGKKKGRGFWSKLLHPRSKKIDSAAGLTHSRTLKERMTAEVR